MLTARCPEDSDHNKFVTTLHVQQEWVVSEHGELLEEGAASNVTGGPNADSLWRCATCGAVAKVTSSRDLLAGR